MSINDVLSLCNFFEFCFEDVRLRLVCKNWKNEIDYLTWSVRLRKHRTVLKSLDDYEDYTKLTFNDVRYSIENAVDYLVIYCCNWMGNVFKPKTKNDMIHYCQLPSFFKDEATKAIVLIDAIWSNSELCFEEFLNNSFENFMVLLILLLASEEGLIHCVMRLKNCLVREYILLFTGFSSLVSRKNFQEEPFVMSVYDPVDHMYFPTMHMFETKQMIEDTNLKNLVPYHQRQIMMALTSVFSYAQNFKLFPHLKSLVFNLGDQFNVPCYDTKLKIVGLQNLFQLLSSYDTNFEFCKQCENYRGVGFGCKCNLWC
jgi:hypothetical protein